MAISGTTGSGKTTWLLNLLKNADQMFSIPPENILYCYGVWQDLFEHMENISPKIQFHDGIPPESLVNSITSNKKHNLIILDDLMSEVVKNESVEILFTRTSHHKKLSVIYINQNMFCQGKNARTINLNCHYLILFKNLRDASQVCTLGRQIFPKCSALLEEAYKDCMTTPYGYLVVDLSPHTDDRFRLRTNIFPGQDTIVYKDGKS
jgi:hypothetical protein